MGLGTRALKILYSSKPRVTAERQRIVCYVCRVGRRKGRIYASGVQPGVREDLLRGT
jgi:hypothetical protein